MAAARGDKPDRLIRRQQFLDVAATRRKWAAPGLILQARPRGEGEAQAPALRLGFTATKKIGNSVIRNRARRRLRAAAHEVLKGLPARPADIVLVARQGTLDRPFAALKDDLATALARLGVAPR